MQRRSKRVRTAPDPQSAGVDPGSNVDIQGATSSKKVRKKAAADADGSKPKRVVRGRRGQLEQMSQLPLDILFEIFGQLDPMDILNLTRTSKALRNMLMQRSATYVWKNARSHIPGLPDCPNDMSEPEYANLVFYPYCHVSNYLDSEDEKLQALHCRLGQANKYRDTMVNAHTLRQYQAEKKDLQGSALDQWCIKRRLQYDLWLKHAKLCEEWNQNRNEERSSWGEEITLLEAGASDEEYQEKQRLSEHKLVKQPKALTERIWNNIKDTLVDFMEKAKARRLVILYKATIKKRGQVLAAVIDTYASSQPLHSVLPSVADVASLPAFRAIIEDLSIDEAITALHFQEAMNDFPQIVTDWRRSKDEVLIKLINDHPASTAKATLATLQHAGTFFKCRQCTGGISYPRILVHHCATALDWNDRTMINDYFKNLGCKPWNYESSVVRYDHRASERAIRILHDCHLVSDTLSSFDLDRLDLRFECLKCKSPEQGRLLMKWPVVVDHAGHHYENSASGSIGSGVIEVASLDSDESSLAYLLDFTRISPMSRAWCHSHSWACLECKTRIAWSTSWEHLNEKHPDLLPTDFTEFEHKTHPDRFFTLHLDASRHILCAPIKVNPRNPVHGFRDAMSFYTLFCYNEGALEAMSQEMAQEFLSVD
ncbi:hypothetical protein DXG01_006821 [Tephrocybe rancida]|nr:hypothetical protein DXG01_006821 [Tephrocybe rancida]